MTHSFSGRSSERSSVDISQHRIDRAHDDLEVSKYFFTQGHMSASVDRSYFAIFHAVRAVLILDDVDTTRHSLVISRFNRDYIESGMFNANFSDMIRSAFRVREYAVYKDYYVVTPEAAQEQINNAEAIINMITHYLESRWTELTKEG
ncbi:MAG: HEPN domain-containing protein [Synergistaceae bacterium]|nr:HEPN domain-containing protein [Synergistaceae bacterium]